MNNPTNRPWCIYVLRDPRDLSVRYVGWTIDLRRRLRDHVTESRIGGRQAHTRKGCWVRSLAKAGFEPIIHCVEHGDGHWAEAEMKWIKHFMELGCKLTNLTLGGEGMLGYVMSKDSVAKLAERMRGRKMSPERLAKHIQMLRSRGPRSEETRRKLSEAFTGRVVSQETRDKLAVINRGKKYSAETVEKRAAKLRGRSLPEATKQKMRGHKRSEETRARMSAWQIGRKLPQATREKLSASKLGKPAAPGVIERLREINRNREHSVAELANLRGMQGKGWKHTEETRLKMSASAKARCAREPRRHSPETKAKIKASLAKRKQQSA